MEGFKIKSTSYREWLLGIKVTTSEQEIIVSLGLWFITISLTFRRRQYAKA